MPSSTTIAATPTRTSGSTTASRSTCPARRCWSSRAPTTPPKTQVLDEQDTYAQFYDYRGDTYSNVRINDRIEKHVPGTTMLEFARADYTTQDAGARRAGHVCPVLRLSRRHLLERPDQRPHREARARHDDAGVRARRLHH